MNTKILRRAIQLALLATAVSASPANAWFYDSQTGTDILWPSSTSLPASAGDPTAPTTGTVTYTVTANIPAPTDFTYDFSTSSWSAPTGSDWVAVPGQNGYFTNNASGQTLSLANISPSISSGEPTTDTTPVSARFNNVATNSVILGGEATTNGNVTSTAQTSNTYSVTQGNLSYTVTNAGNVTGIIGNATQASTTVDTSASGASGSTSTAVTVSSGNPTITTVGQYTVTDGSVSGTRTVVDSVNGAIEFSQLTGNATTDATTGNVTANVTTAAQTYVGADGIYTSSGNLVVFGQGGGLAMATLSDPNSASTAFIAANGAVQAFSDSVQGISQVNLYADTNVYGILTVTGNMPVGAAGINGGAPLYTPGMIITDMLQVNMDEVVGGNLTVVGQLSTNGLVNTGSLATDTLTVNGDASVGGNLSVAGMTNTNGITNVGNIATDTLTVAGQAQFGSDVSIAGLTSTNGISNVGNIATDTLTVTGGASVGGDFQVTGMTYTNGIENEGNLDTTTLSVDADAAIGGNLAVAGLTTTNGIVNNGDITTDTLTTTGNATVGGDLVVSGNSYLGGNAEHATMVVTPNSVTVASGTNVNFGGNVLHGIGAGTERTDAANMGQLWDVRLEARRGIASASAISGVPALEAGKRFNVGVGFGSFKSESAFAIGANARFTDRVTAKVAVGMASSDTTVSAGIGVSF